MNTKRKPKNHRDEIAEISRLESYFNQPFEEEEEDVQKETLVRFKQLLREDELSGGALSDFYNHEPWRIQFNDFLNKLETQWEKMLLNPKERNEVSSDFLAGGLKILKTIKEKMMRDSAKSHELGLARKAEMEARNVNSIPT